MPWDIALGYTAVVVGAAVSLIFAIWAVETRRGTSASR
jgi:hypothetical protein